MCEEQGPRSRSDSFQIWKKSFHEIWEYINNNWNPLSKGEQLKN